ncbi:MAG TPA: FHA domain-containing protein [Vicinamibacteria bacterium]
MKQPEPTPQLRVTTPAGETRTLHLEGEPVSLGRLADNTLCFPDDDGLSRRHLVIEKENDEWVVKNLASKNGTFVNGALIEDKHSLRSGDRVIASCVVLSFSVPSFSGRPVTFEPPVSDNSELSAESTSLKEILCSRPPDASMVSEVARGSGKEGAIWAFLRAGRELAARRPLPELFQVTLDLSLEAAGAERGVLLTIDDADRLEVQASVGGELRISSAVRDKVLREKTSLLVRDVLRDQLLKGSETVVDEGVRSLMAVPLQTEDRVIGLMYLDTLDPRRNFTTDDLNLLTAMANVAGIRIERERWELQRRTLIAENIASLGRLAAALSHEFNTPLGALRSAVDTLVRAAAKQGSAPPEEQERLELVQADLRKSLDASLARMEEVISRIQRFTNLDRSEMQVVDVNEILEDIVALGETARDSSGISVKVESAEVPSLLCHRQTLTTALSSLFRFAVEAARRKGESGEVRLFPRSIEDRLEVHIEDNGGGMPEEKLARLFDPGFQIASGRVAAGNWTLFAARQAILDQGGEIRVSNVVGRGTTFVVSLPRTPAPSA